MLIRILIEFVVMHPIVTLVIASPFVIFLAHQKWHGERMQRRADLERRKIKL
jgi:hypothetical protein